MTEAKLTLGKAIDQIIEALQSFDDKDRKAILNTVCSHLQIELGMRNPVPLRREEPASSPQIQQERRSHEHGIDIKQLKEEKKPNSARQMACLVAYYLQELAPESERKDSINTKDLEKYFKQAGYKLPTKLEQLLVDSKGSGYFDSSKRGEYSLTRVGYNLVAHSLPPKEQS